MKATTTAPNPWPAELLPLSSPLRLGRLAGAYRADPAAFQPYYDPFAPQVSAGNSRPTERAASGLAGSTGDQYLGMLAGNVEQP